MRFCEMPTSNGAQKRANNNNNNNRRIVKERKISICDFITSAIYYSAYKYIVCGVYILCAHWRVLRHILEAAH